MATQNSKTAADLVKEAKARVENLTPEQVARELEQGSLLVDLRDSEERRQNGVIEGALHIPRGMLEFRADPTSPYHDKAFSPDKRVILHCASGGRSALGADTLQRMGYSDVAHLEGGFGAWKQQGLPTEDASG